MNLNLTRPLAVFDLEATGINIASDRIVEIFILKVHPDGSQTEFKSLINPRIPIPPEVVEIHGITNEKVKDAPTFLDIAFDIQKFLEGCDLAGYNSNRYDIPLLKEEFYRIGITWDLSNTKFVDVYKIFAQMEGRDLSSAYKFYCNKELVDAHSAEYDVRATFDVLLSQLDRYKDKLDNNVDALHTFTGDEQFIDSGYRLIMDNGVPRINFGKHKGKSVEEVLSKEPHYYDWIMKSDFLQDTKHKLTELKNQYQAKKKAANNPKNTGNKDPNQPTLF